MGLFVDQTNRYKISEIKPDKGCDLMKYQICKAAVEDAKGITKVHTDLWRSTYKVIVSLWVN
ncbi:hypothetical protein [Paenisporosarcina antarctica]|uniref:Uncharacterized protein n=1 Tax=Paenisporosarcina antarctica TaxID=417367 RepID=A0A4P7A2R6_9BACL|nr:hypothetical protein [Paenisporosarcina antarctica]QBP42944.1 hypothetical protein E2636_18160 [Paenisporosarcina antarctica]